MAAQVDDGRAVAEDAGEALLQITRHNDQTCTAWVKVPLELAPEPDTTVKFRYHDDSGRCRIYITVPSRPALVRGAGEFAKLLHPDVRFRAGEWVDALRQKFVHHVRQSVFPALAAQAPKIRNQTAITPPSVFSFLRDNWGLLLSSHDPCPADHAGSSGLASQWEADVSETIFVNPPFKHAGEWVDKALCELRAGRVHSVAMLLPARVTPRWFHRALAHASRIVAANGSVRFRCADGKPFPKAFPWGIVLMLLKREKAAAPARLETFAFCDNDDDKSGEDDDSGDDNNVKASGRVTSSSSARKRQRRSSTAT